MAPTNMTDKELKRRAKVFQLCDFNQAKAAAQLGMSRSAFQNSMRHAEEKGFIKSRAAPEPEEIAPSPFAIEHAPQVASVDGAKWVVKST